MNTQYPLNNHIKITVQTIRASRGKNAQELTKI
jgi:hypothetical protein